MELCHGDRQLCSKDARDPVTHTKYEGQRERNAEEGHACRQETVDGTMWLGFSRASPERLVEKDKTETHCQQHPRPVRYI